MKKRIKYLLSTLIIFTLVLLVNPTKANANVVPSTPVTNNSNCAVSIYQYEDLGPVSSISIGGHATLSGSIQTLYNNANENIQTNFRTSSYFYSYNNTPFVCVRSSGSSPNSGVLQKISNCNTYDGSHAGLSTYSGFTYSQIAVGITKYLLANRTSDGNGYIVGHAILSGVLHNDWTLYDQIRGIPNAGPDIISSFVNNTFYTRISNTQKGAYYYEIIPNSNSQQILITTQTPPDIPPQSYGGVAIKKVTSDGSDVSGYDFRIYKGQCSSSSKTLVTTRRTGSDGILEYWGNNDITAGTPYCFEEVLIDGYASKNGAKSSLKPTAGTNLFEVNASANPKSGVALRNVTNGTTTSKGYIQIRKTITVPGQELDGYSYLIYHSGCANKTNSVSGDIWFLTDGNGYVEYGKDSNGNGTLTPGDTYCVLEQTNECTDGSGDRCAVRHTHGQVPTTTFRPVTSEYQITVGGGVNQVSFTNTDTPDIPGSLEFCLGAKKYMEADDGEWYPLVGVPFELWHFADNRIEQVDTTKYSDSTGYIRFDFSEDELINHDRTVKNFFIVEGTKGGSDNWQQYYKQDGNKTPYVYGLSSISTSGPVIGHFWNVKWPDWVESSYRDNNLGLWSDQSLIGCGETGPSGASTNESKTLINTKVYFCLRVKKAPEDSSDKIQSDEIGAMEFVAEHPGSDPISSNSENGSVKLQSDGTAIVSFFTGDSYDTGVTVDGQFYDDYASTPGSNLSGGPDKLLPDEWTVREVSPPEGYTLNEDKVLTVRPTQMKAYFYDNSKPKAFIRAREDCLSGGTSDGETFAPYVWTGDHYTNAENYAKINDLTVNNPDSSIADQYVIKNQRLVLQFYKEAEDDSETTPNDQALLEGAKFVAKRKDGGVNGKAYAKIKDVNGNGYIDLGDRKITKLKNNGVVEQKLCFVTDGYTQNYTEANYLISGDTSVEQDGSHKGEVCLANVSVGQGDENKKYIVTEVDSADSHTFSQTKEKEIMPAKVFTPKNDNNTFINYSTEFEFTKQVEWTDRFTNVDLTRMTFSIFEQDENGNAKDTPITLKVAGDGVYDYLRGTSDTTYLHVRVSDSKIVVKHLPKGKYIIKEMQLSTCDDPVASENCIGFYMPTDNDQRFEITACSNSLATACGTGNYRRVTASIMNEPTEITFTKSDFYHEYDQADIAEQGNTIPGMFANDEERSDFDRIVFGMYNKNGERISLQFVGNHGDCTSDEDYAEYRYVVGTTGDRQTTELHTCGGHIKITHLCRGNTYTIKEESVPENSVFVREDTDSTPIEQQYQIPCDQDSPNRRITETALISDKPTRVTFEKRDAKYNYLIPDETTTFEVYRCPKGQECHPGDYNSVEDREAHNMELVAFYPRNVITNDEEDPGVEVYKMISYSDKTKCDRENRANCYVTSINPHRGKLVLRYLASNYNYVLLETVAPKNYVLPEGRRAETEFTVVNDTVTVENIDVPNQATGLLIRKYDDEGNLLGGAKFKIYKVTNYNANKKPQDQEAELLKFKTIRDGIYEARPVLDTDVVMTCTGADCSNTDSFTLDQYMEKADFDSIFSSSGELMRNVLKEGTAIVQYLEYDNYYVVEEVEAPKGHSLPSEEDDRFTLVHIGNNTTVIEDTEGKFVNYPTPFTFYKFDEYNKPLDGAKFKLQKLNDNKSYVTLNLTKVEGEDSLYKVDPDSSNDIIETTDGKATVYYLEEGQYRIVEVEAAPGKELPKKTINVATFFVDKDGNVFGENIITNKKPTQRIEIKPEAKASLIVNIQTGRSVVRYGLVIAILVAFISGLMIFIKKRK